MTILALDPGVTTGWALVDARGTILGTGNLQPEELGVGLDSLIRRVHVAGRRLVAVVEQMPSVGATGDLAMTLEIVRRTIMHWLTEVYEIAVDLVTPGVWKNSRVAKVTAPTLYWQDEKTTQHQRDAITMGKYYLEATSKR